MSSLAVAARLLPENEFIALVLGQWVCLQRDIPIRGAILRAGTRGIVVEVVPVRQFGVIPPVAYYLGVEFLRDVSEGSGRRPRHSSTAVALDVVDLDAVELTSAVERTSAVRLHPSCNTPVRDRHNDR